MSRSIQIPWGPNLVVGKQALSQVVKNPTPTQRGRADHGRLETAARNNTNWLSPKLAKGHRRGRGEKRGVKVRGHLTDHNAVLILCFLVSVV